MSLREFLRFAMMIRRTGFPDFVESSCRIVRSGSDGAVKGFADTVRGADDSDFLKRGWVFRFAFPDRKAFISFSFVVRYLL